jgi:hypothetical protein
MSATYFIERADTCRRLAHDEPDASMRDVLYHLENDYRLKARHARRHEQMSQSLAAARQQQA